MSNINYRTKVFNDYKPEDLKFEYKEGMISAIHFKPNEKHPNGYTWRIGAPQTPILVGHNGAGKTTLFNLIKETVKLKKPKQNILSFDLIDPSEEDALSLTTVKPQYIRLMGVLNGYINAVSSKEGEREEELFKITSFLAEISDKIFLPRCSFRAVLQVKLNTREEKVHTEFGISFYTLEGDDVSPNDLSNSTLCLFIFFLKIFLSIKKNEDPIVFIDGALDRYHPSLAELLINELTGHFPSTQFFIITNNPAVIMDLKNPNDTYFHLHEIFGE